MTLAPLLLIVATGLSDDKPVFLNLDAEVGRSALIAEVELLEVKKAEWMGRGAKGGALKVRVTSDAGKVWRGFSHLGKTLELKPPAFGPGGATHALGAAMVADNRKRLFVLDKDGKHLLMAGTSRSVGGVPGYRLESWCDYNAVFIHSEMGRKRGEHPWSEVRDVSSAELSAKTTAQRLPRFVELARAMLTGVSADTEWIANGLRGCEASPEVEARILVAALPQLARVDALRATARLRELAGEATPPLPIDGSAGQEDVARAWRMRVEPPAYTQTFKTAAARKEFVFSDPRVWKVEASEKGGWLDHRPGQKYKTPQRSPHNIALIADWTFGDFVLECEMQQTGREYGHRDQCLFFGFQDPTRFYYVHVSTKADAHAHNVFIVNKKPRRAFAKKTTKGIDWGKGAWRKIRLERKGKDIRVWFEDMKTPIMLASDETHGRGWIGFGSFDDEGRVRNIKVWSDSAKRQRTKSFATDAPAKKK